MDSFEQFKIKYACDNLVKKGIKQLKEYIFSLPQEKKMYAYQYCVGFGYIDKKLENNLN